MLAAVTDAGHPFQADGWRLGAAPGADAGRARPDRRRRPGRAAWSTASPVSAAARAEHHVARARRVDGQRHQAVVNVEPRTRSRWCYRGQRFVFERPDVFADHGRAVGDGTIVAPMPGTVLDVEVEPTGEQVEEGQVLGVLEAMKMELALKAPFAGTVTDRRRGGRRAGRPRRHALRGGAGRWSARRSSRRRAARAGHDLRGRAARRPAERGGAGARRGQGRVRPPPARRRAAGRRGDQLRAPEVGAAARRRRGADGRGWARPGADCPVLVPNERGLDRALELGVPAHRDLRQRHRDVRAAEPQPQPRRAVRDVRADRDAGPRRRARRPRLRLDVLRRPVGGRRAGRPGGRGRQAALRPRRQPAQPRRHHRGRHRRAT